MRKAGPYRLAPWSNKDRLVVQDAERWVPPKPPAQPDSLTKLLYEIAVLWCAQQETPTLKGFCESAGFKPTSLLRLMTEGGVTAAQLQRTIYCIWIHSKLRLSMVFHFNGSTQVMFVNHAGQPEESPLQEVVIPLRKPTPKVTPTPDAYELYDKLRTEYEKRR